jgi:hypothetical protein
VTRGRDGVERELTGKREGIEVRAGGQDRRRKREGRRLRSGVESRLGMLEREVSEGGRVVIGLGGAGRKGSGVGVLEDGEGFELGRSRLAAAKGGETLGEGGGVEDRGSEIGEGERFESRKGSFSRGCRDVVDVVVECEGNLWHVNQTTYVSYTSQAAERREGVGKKEDEQKAP